MSALSRIIYEQRHMACDFKFEIVVGERDLARAESVALEGHRLIEKIESEITEFRESSPVWVLNHSKAGEWVSVPPYLAQILIISIRFFEESHGYFSPFSKSSGSVDLHSFEFNSSEEKIRRFSPNFYLGFGAIGKGFALDEVATLFRREGLNHFRLSSGGSSWTFSGLDENEEHWKISWAWKKDRDGDFYGRVLSAPTDDLYSIGVSGDLEQGNHFRHNGNSVPLRAMSSIYVGRSAAEADALSTALLVGASLIGDEILTNLSKGIKNPSLAYMDLEERILYNRNFETHFLSA